MITSIADLPDDFPCANVLHYLGIPERRRDHALPDYYRRRINELSEDEKRAAAGLIAAIEAEDNSEPPYVRMIAELPCSLGQVRRMANSEITSVVGVTSGKVADFRVFIGPPQSDPGRRSSDVKVSTCLERNLRKLQ